MSLDLLLQWDWRVCPLLCMQYHPAHRGTQMNQAYMGKNMSIDCGAGSPDDLTLSELLNFDGLIEPSSPLAADLLFSSFNYSSLNPMFGNCVSFTSPDRLELARDPIQEDEGTSGCGYSRFNEKLAAQKPTFEPEVSPCSTRDIEFKHDASVSQLYSAHNTVKWTTSDVLKPIGGFSFTDRMLRVLSLLKESSGGGFLTQVWMPVKQGDSYMLSTCEQPFLLDQVLAGFREVSRVFTFSMENTTGLFPGVPGRVFMSGLPEWTSNVIYYNKSEYLRGDYAVSHEVKGSLAVPIFYPNKSKCSAVLELVTMKEKPNFSIELENVCRAMQDVDLRITKAHAHHQNLTKDQKSALSEILDVLRVVCHAHMLPLALTWIPLPHDSELFDDDEDDTAVCMTNGYLKETMLCIQESACYVNDPQMHGFLRACAEHCLAKGQGSAGKAFQSNHPFFSPDVKGYDIAEYPLAHHARKFGLHSAVAIRLRSTYTGDDDFVLEFFLPVNCKGSAEQQLLLNNLSATMQRICKSLRTVLDAEAPRPEVSKVGTITMQGANNQPSESARNPQSVYNKKSQMCGRNKDAADTPCAGETMESDEQVKYSSQKPREKRITSVKHISLNVLQKYFAGSLKDAAICLGVCPTTLKRICRQYGISRWPSRKIKKVNHSLKKIQCVINSVHGVEGTFQYDPASGCLLAGVTPENLPGVTLEPVNHDLPLSSPPRCDFQPLDRSNDKLAGERAKAVSSSLVEKEDETDFIVEINTGKEHSHPSVSNMTNSSGESASSCQFFKESSKKGPFAANKVATFVVKAAYKADIVRFKLLPSMDFHHLYEEIGRRFKLRTARFELKYMDDEEEWVMLADDSDLQECIEVSESTASQCIRLQVRDVPLL